VRVVDLKRSCGHSGKNTTQARKKKMALPRNRTQLNGADPPSTETVDAKSNAIAT
jgi:hypothetical protein